jgi:hypothetical protein
MVGVTAANSAADVGCSNKPDYRRNRLLRLRRLRECRRRPAEQCDEVAPLHSITSSARASSVTDTSKPNIGP